MHSYYMIHVFCQCSHDSYFLLFTSRYTFTIFSNVSNFLMYKAKIIVLWYDGYETAPGTKLYNPRSVIGALTYSQLRSYWMSSGPYDEIFYYIGANVDAVKDDIALIVAATKAGDTRTMTESKKGRMKNSRFFHTPCFIFCLYARIGFSPSAN